MEKKNPKISVIVPVYNVEQYLCRCIDSILAQTFTDFELLLIDDGSRDRSGEICDKYARKDERVRVFHKENGGVCLARNLGLEKAKGEWISFVDGDDFLDCDYYCNFLSFHDASDLVFTGFQIIESDKKKIVSEKYCQYNRKNNNISNLLSYPFMSYTPWGIFIKSQIIQCNKVRFDPNLKVGEDTNFIYTIMALSTRISLLPIIGYNYISNRNIFLDKYYMNVETYASHISTILGTLFVFEDKWGIKAYNVEMFLKEIFFNLLFNYLSKCTYSSYKRNLVYFKLKGLYSFFPENISKYRYLIIRVSLKNCCIGFMLMLIYKYIKNES